MNGVDTLYTLNGKKITHIRKGTENATGTDAVRMHFFYDAQGRPMLVRTIDTDYAYLHNLQGDVVGIVDMDGVSVVKYRYDAWGKPVATKGSMAETLGRANPFRYRGYVWDGETGLYYLRSRYYNPEWGRFVNADNVLGLSQRLLNHDLFSYCCQNPVNRSDSDGNMDYAASLGQATTFMLPTISPLAVITGLTFLVALCWPASTANSDATAIPKYDGSETVPNVFLPTAYALPKTRKATDAQTVTITESITARTLDPRRTAQYWVPIVTKDGIIPTIPLTFTQAKFVVLTGNNVLAKNYKAARTLGKSIMGRNLMQA